MKTKVLVIFGGVSSEHDVSLVSASSVISQISADKYEVKMLGISKTGRSYLYSGPVDLLPDDKWLDNPGLLENCVISTDREHHGIIYMPSGKTEYIDVVFPVLHGKFGEDGTIQGLLEIAGIPYVGCGTASSAVCMDKSLTNSVCDFNNIPHAKWIAVKRNDFNNNKDIFVQKVRDYLGYPVFVKPANAGSSVGINKVKTEDELVNAFEIAFSQDDKIVVEEGIDGIEVECAVLGNDSPVASTVGEIVPCNEFYDYDAKYIRGTSELHIPARLDEETLQIVRQSAVKAFKAFDCKGMARIDFFVRKSDGKVFLNEPNTIPGFTSISMYSKLFEASGIPYCELIDKLIMLALEK